MIPCKSRMLPLDNKFLTNIRKIASAHRNKKCCYFVTIRDQIKWPIDDAASSILPLGYVDVFVNFRLAIWSFIRERKGIAYCLRHHLRRVPKKYCMRQSYQAKLNTLAAQFFTKFLLLSHWQYKCVASCNKTSVGYTSKKMNTRHFAITTPVFAILIVS